MQGDSEILMGSSVGNSEILVGPLVLNSEILAGLLWGIRNPCGVSCGEFGNPCAIACGEFGNPCGALAGFLVGNILSPDVIQVRVGVVAEVAPPRPKPVTSRRQFCARLVMAFWRWRGKRNLCQQKRYYDPKRVY